MTEELQRIEAAVANLDGKNDKAHAEIINEIKRINGEGTKAGQLWRARFEGAMAGGKAVWVAIGAVLGALVPTALLVISVVQKW